MLPARKKIWIQFIWIEVACLNKLHLKSFELKQNWTQINFVTNK